MYNHFMVDFVVIFNIFAFNLEKVNLMYIFSVFTPIVWNLFFIMSLFHLFLSIQVLKLIKHQGNRLHHKLTISRIFNQINVNIIKHYVHAKFVVSKCKNSTKSIYISLLYKWCIFSTCDVLMWSTYDLHFN
jgi:hypothetical protein